MKLNQYIYETVRTLKEMPDRDQEIHLLIGIASELLGEVFPILAGGIVNKDELEEELGDVMWYIGCYCNLNNIEPKPSEAPPENGIAKVLGDILEVKKKEWAYVKEFPQEKKEDFMQKLIFSIQKIAKEYSIDFEKMLDKNIEKLRIRFPDKFTEDKAINKDTAKEQTVFNATNKETEKRAGESEE